MLDPVVQGQKGQNDLSQDSALQKSGSSADKIEQELSQLYLEKPSEDQIIRENQFLKFFINQIVIPFGSRIPGTIRFLCQSLEIDDMSRILLFINKNDGGAKAVQPAGEKKRKRQKLSVQAEAEAGN